MKYSILKEILVVSTIATVATCLFIEYVVDYEKKHSSTNKK